MSNKHYSSQKPIIHSRESSIGSRTSDSSMSSKEGYTSSSRDSMRREYYDGSEGRDGDRVERKRVPDNDRHYVTTTTSRDGKTLVHEHYTSRYDPQEPRASEAAKHEYHKRSQRKESRSKRNK